jgi:hypothetical protein
MPVDSNKTSYIYSVIEVILAQSIKQVAKRDRSSDETAGELDPDFSAFLQRAGSATYEAKIPKNMDRREYYNLLSTIVDSK